MKQFYFLFASLICSVVSAQDFIINTIDEFPVSYPRGIRAVDLDNDNNLDILMISINSDPEISCWFGDGQGGFSTKVIIDDEIEFLGSGQGDDIEVLDVNNDGFFDIVAGAQKVNFEGEIYWWENNQNRTFGDSNLIEIGGKNIADILVFDVDNNGFDDIVTSDTSSNPSTGSLFYIPNMGDGSFGPRIEINTSRVAALSSGLINDDEFIDLIVGSDYISEGIYVLVNQGDGTFGAPLTIDAFNPFGTDVADIDGDNILDVLACGGSNAERLVWYKGNGDGTFGDKVIVMNDGFLQIVNCNAADFDSDGKLDIVAAPQHLSQDEGIVPWWNNDGNQNFGSPITITSNFLYNFDIEIADINEDGKNDFILSSREGVYFFENNITLSVESFNTLSQIELLPNPSNGSYELIGDISTLKRIEVFDLKGKLILSFERTIPSFINIENETSGLYLVKIYSDYNIEMKRIFKL